VQRFTTDWTRRRNGPIIARLTQEFEARRLAIVGQLLTKLNGRLTPEDRAYIEGAFKFAAKPVSCTARSRHWPRRRKATPAGIHCGRLCVNSSGGGIALRIDKAFHLSFYVTLTMACTCLAQARPSFAWVPLVCMPLVRYLRSRWPGGRRDAGIITETTSNYLGIFIGLATGWLDSPAAATLRSRFDRRWRAMAGGPLCRISDPSCWSCWWSSCFGQATLPTSGSSRPSAYARHTRVCARRRRLFMALLLFYLASLLWCLALFHLYRARHPAGTAPLFAPNDASTGPPIGKPVYLPSGTALRGEWRRCHGASWARVRWRAG